MRFLIFIFIIIFIIKLRIENELYYLEKSINNEFSKSDKIIKCYDKMKYFSKCFADITSTKVKSKITKENRFHPLSDNYYLYNIPNYIRKKKILIYIVCLCREFIERESVRRTWGRNDKDYATVFIIGITNKKCDNKLKIESKYKNDIIRINIVESFFNNTLFTKYLFKLLPSISYNIKYFMKCSLDMMIDWNIYEEIFSREINKKNIFLVPNIFKFKRINSDDNYKYSSSLIVADYYNKIIPHNGIKSFVGFFYCYDRNLSLNIYYQSEKYKYIMGAEDQYISIIFYTMNFSNYKRIKSHVFIHDNILKNKNIPLIHRIKGIYMYSLYRYFKLNIHLL